MLPTGTILLRKCSGRFVEPFIHRRDTKPINSCLAPGGYVEVFEGDIDCHSDDGSLKPDNPIKIYAGLLRSSLVKMDRTPRDMAFYEAMLKKAGFEDIKTLVLKEPIGPWAKDPVMKKIGVMSLLNCESIFDSYGMAAFTRALGMEPGKAKAICDGARQAARNKNYHSYFK